MITWIYLDYLAILNEFHCQLNTTCTLVETLCILQFAAIKNTELQQKINNERNNNKNHGKQENIMYTTKAAYSFSSLLVCFWSYTTASSI